MIRIDKEYFYKVIGIEPNDILIESKIPAINSENINEFKIGKNYFYEIIKNDKLIAVQKKLNVFLINNIEINSAAVAYRKKYSYLNLFEPHKNNYYFIRLDIRSFFHSIDIEDIKKTINPYFINPSEQEEKLIESFIKLVTYTVPDKSPNTKFRNKQILPMGFITSPAISNIIFRKIDIQIQQLCSDKNIIYSRYADDMLFSSKKETTYLNSDNFINEIRILLSQLGLKLNQKKTLKAKHTLSLNGYVIQNGIKGATPEIRISNKKTKILKKLIYLFIIKNETPSIILRKLFGYKLKFDRFQSNPKAATIRKYYSDQLKNKVAGYRSYLISIIKFNSKHNCTNTTTLREYIKIIEKLNLIIKNLL